MSKDINEKRLYNDFIKSNITLFNNKKADRLIRKCFREICNIFSDWIDEINHSYVIYKGSYISCELFTKSSRYADIDIIPLGRGEDIIDISLKYKIMSVLEDFQKFFDRYGIYVTTDNNRVFNIHFSIR